MQLTCKLSCRYWSLQSVLLLMNTKLVMVRLHVCSALLYYSNSVNFKRSDAMGFEHRVLSETTLDSLQKVHLVCILTPTIGRLWQAMLARPAYHNQSFHTLFIQPRPKSCWHIELRLQCIGLTLQRIRCDKTNAVSTTSIQEKMHAILLGIKPGKMLPPLQILEVHTISQACFDRW